MYCNSHGGNDNNNRSVNALTAFEKDTARGHRSPCAAAAAVFRRYTANDSSRTTAQKVKFGTTQPFCFVNFSNILFTSSRCSCTNGRAVKAKTNVSEFFDIIRLGTTKIKSTFTDQSRSHSSWFAAKNASKSPIGTKIITFVLASNTHARPYLRRLGVQSLPKIV